MMRGETTVCVRLGEWRLLYDRHTTHDDGNKVPSNSINLLYSLYSILLLEYDVDFDDYIILSVTVAVVLYFT